MPSKPTPSIGIGDFYFSEEELAENDRIAEELRLERVRRVASGEVLPTNSVSRDIAAVRKLIGR
jgi:hypothetical protein